MALANGWGIYNVSSNNTFGGTVAGAGNIIAHSNLAGVFIASGPGNVLLSNSIFNNGGLGIDLDPYGITPSDPGDGDSGANNRQNFPDLYSAINYPGSTTVNSSFSSTPNTSFTIQFFSNNTCDASGYGEGESLLGGIVVTTDAGGQAPFQVTFPTAIPAGQFITAIATDPSGNTSEFSQCEVVQ